MEVVTVYKDKKTHVVLVYLNDELFYTHIYVYDNDGYVEKNIRVFANGTIDAQ